MPKIVELTVEISIQKVSCPGVWLCQDGRVSLSVFALGTSYDTCLLPPVFPLIFKDVFYFRKRFQETCALNNICCLLKDETIFCELVQLSEDCSSGECIILAQYLGALNDVLFPPNMCSSEGVDLLMRRTKNFPGILSPKIEIATKVRIDEVWNQRSGCQFKTASCHCSQNDAEKRQRQVCHTSQYHRSKCNSANKAQPRSRSHSRSESSRSCISFKEPDIQPPWKCPNVIPPCPPRHCPSRPQSAGRARFCSRYVCNVDKGNKTWVDGRENRPEENYQDLENEHNNSKSPPIPHSPRQPKRRPLSPCYTREYEVFNVEMERAPDTSSIEENARAMRTTQENNDESRLVTNKMFLHDEERLQKTLLESRYIEDDINERLESRFKEDKTKYKIHYNPRIKPCICEICRRYHELFHAKKTKS